MTNFYSTSGVCTPSRASLMTGCYPRRVDMHEDEAGAGSLTKMAAPAARLPADDQSLRR
jgi:arylsulfatase A-like enzyme